MNMEYVRGTICIPPFIKQNDKLEGYSFLFFKPWLNLFDQEVRL